MTEDSKSYKALVESNQNSVNIMFGPTHLVILFAVVLCANALPATSGGTASLDSAVKDLTKIESKIESAIPSLELDPQRPAGDRLAAASQGDLKTDATIHFGYGYYGPRWFRSYGYGSPYYWR